MNKKYLVYGLIACAGIFATGCDDVDYGNGSIGVGIGIGVGRHHHNHDGHYHRPPSYGNGHGHGPGRPGHGNGHCGPRGCWNLEEANWAMDADVSDLSSRYQIPVPAAQKITAAFAGVETQGISSFRSIGLSKGDLKDIINSRMPSKSTVRDVSASLGLSEAQSRSTLVAMSNEFNAQVANPQSDYWQFCTSEGQWKTNKNNSCSSLNEQGCGPATGARLCF